MVGHDMDPRVERAVEAFNDHDLDAMMAELAEGGTFVDPLEPDRVSGAELREYCADLFEAFPDIHVEVERVLADDAGGTAMVCTYTGTHRGSMEGIPPTGRTIAVPGVSVVIVGEDGITHWRDYWDQQTFAEQLGLTFPAVVPKLTGMVAAKLREIL